MFTWDDKLSEDNRNELDIELSRWGVPNGKNAQYVVQPFYAQDNLAPFAVPAGVMTHTFRWEPGKVSFRTFRGSSTEATAGCQRACFTPGYSPPSSETIHIDLYDFHNAENVSQRPMEVVIERFEYSP